MASNLYNQLNNQKKPASVQDIMQEVRQSGMSAKDLFFKKAKDMGADPRRILEQVPTQYR